VERSIKIKTEDELAILRDAGKILGGIIKDLTSFIKSGITTKVIDDEAEALIKDRGVIPAFKGYRGFPGCACISVNDEVVHGIPGNREIKDGDIVSVDVGIIYQDYYSDTAVSIGIGKIDSEFQKLLDVTKTSLEKGIEQARIGNKLSDISYAIQKYVESNKLAIVREFVGHGIGKNLHEDPEIPNFGPPGKGPELKEGMVFAIEPMVNLGSWQTKIESDGWTVVTQDGKASAHFEHTIAITGSGPEIFTS